MLTWGGFSNAPVDGNIDGASSPSRRLGTALNMASAN